MKLLYRLALPLIFIITTGALFAQTTTPEKNGEKKRDPALAPIEDVAGRPRVLLIGDSISIGYTLPVRALLAEVANVHRIAVNGSSTDVGLAKLDDWLATGGAGKQWAVIHFNWGLHDLKHWKDGKMDPTGPQVNALEAYEKNLRAIVEQLKKTGAKLIFATTTPVPEGSSGRVAGDEIAYNSAAARVMKAEGVAINDLHALATAKLAEIQRPQNVHFTDAGSKVLAEQVAAEIRKALGK